MNVVKIPSSNIYGVGDDNLNISKNQISKAEITKTIYNRRRSDNILIKDYVINYFEEIEKGDGSKVLIYVGNDPEKNGDIVLGEPYTMVVKSEIFPEANSVAYYVVDPPEYTKLEISNPVRLQRDNYTFYRDFKGYTLYYTRHKVRVNAEGTDRYFDTKIIAFLNEFDDLSNSFIHQLGSSIGGKRVLELASDTTGQGNYTSYVLSDTITVEGNYYLPFETSEEYGESFGTNFSLPSNELVQSANTLNGNELYPTLLENIVKKYSKGKEVYTIKCSVGEYYDIYEAKVIDPYDANCPATFEKHEIVEPYVFTSRGEVPLSEKADGTPKRFEIIGIDFSYKGVVWQELTLQEYIE